MPSKIEKARSDFEDGLTYLQKLLDNKDKIKQGLEELSLGVRGHKTLFDYYFRDVYEFLEDDFGPEIRLIEKQIGEGKLSKRKYNLLIEDTFIGDRLNIFLEYLKPIHRLFNNEQTVMKQVTDTNKNAWFGFNKIYDRLDILDMSIRPIENIIRYGLEKEDRKYYYFEWYNNKEIKEDTNKENLNTEKLEGKGMYLNRNNGEVYKDGEKVGIIGISTQEFELFKFLYENKGEVKSYEEIFTKLNGGKIEKSKSKYLADIKNRIKGKEVKKIIENVQGKGYLIR